MRRSSRFNRPGLTGSSRSALLLNNDGDGSTLSLDFTTGVLDSRLTFTRGSNATFINSSGFVEWSASNHAPRTNWNFTSPTGSGWNAATLSGTGTFQWVGNGTVIAASGSAGQAFTIITTPTGIAEGLRYVMSVTASSVTGSPTIQSIFDFTSASGNTYFKNGAAATAGTTVASGDRISVSAIASATSMNVRIGCGAWFANRTNESVTLTQFHWHPGSAPVAYYENTGTSPRYDSARFDHDPTTLAPMGLLVEGQTPTLNAYSEDYTNAYWQKINTTISTTSVTCPDNIGRTTVRVVDNATNASHSIRRGIATTAGTTYTLSFFVRKGSTDTFAAQCFWLSSYQFTLTVSSIDNNTQSITSASGVNATATRVAYSAFGSSPWYRYSITFTHPLAVGAATPDFNFFPINNTGSYVGSGNHTDFFGIQLEAGSGASSYIPTGASTATRVADSCVMTGTNFSSWFAGATEGVLYTQFEKPRSQSGTIGHDHAAVGSQYGSGTAFIVYAAASVYYPTTLLWPTGGVLFPGGIASAIPNVSKQAGKWFGGNDATNYANGLQGTTSAGTGTLAPNMLTIGANSASGTAATRDWLNACVRTVKFWPVALPDSQIIALTTP